MKKDLTEIIFILDRSGSMEGLESDTIGGYNAFLKSQQQTVGEALVTTVLFDDEYELLQYKWEFLFLGANIDASKEAENLGINANRSATYAASAVGTQALFGGVTQSIMSYRKTGRIEDDWSKNINDSSNKKNS